MTPIPSTVLRYGLLGVLPFLAPPVLSLAAPELRPLAGQFAAFYAALILSFLGGARWGLAVAQPNPSARVVTLAMLPTLTGLALLLFPDAWRAGQLLGLAALLAAHFAWDRRAPGLPAWYPRLRALLTVGAIAGLMAQTILAGTAGQRPALPFEAPKSDPETRSVAHRASRAEILF